MINKKRSRKKDGGNSGGDNIDTNEESKEDRVATSEQEQKSKTDANRAALFTFLLNEIQSQDDVSRQLISFIFILSSGYITIIISIRDKISFYDHSITALFIILPLLMFFLSASYAARNLRPSIDKSTLDEGISPEYLVYLIDSKNKEFRYAYILMAIGFDIILIGVAGYIQIL